MNYLDGSEIVTGDAVLIEYGKATGAVVAVVEQERMAEFNVDEPGVMIKAASIGMFYIPVSMFEDQGLRFQSRGLKSNLRWIEPR